MWVRAIAKSRACVCANMLRWGSKLLENALSVGIRKYITTPRCFGIPKKHKMPPRPHWLVVEEEIEESFIKGGRGPGGQKINKTNSKVQLRHIPSGIVVTCQATRSQELNRKRARELMALKLDELQNPLTNRMSIVNERKQKVKQSKSKKANRKYKLLDEQKQLEQSVSEPELDPELEFNMMISEKRISQN